MKTQGDLALNYAVFDRDSDHQTMRHARQPQAHVAPGLRDDGVAHSSGSVGLGMGLWLSNLWEILGPGLKTAR